MRNELAGYPLAFISYISQHPEAISQAGDISAAFTEWQSPTINGKKYFSPLDQTPLDQTAGGAMQNVTTLPDGRYAGDYDAASAWGKQNAAQGDFAQNFLNGPGPVMALGGALGAFGAFGPEGFAGNVFGGGSPAGAGGPPSSYWNMGAEAGGTASDAAPAAAGSFGSEGGGITGLGEGLGGGLDVGEGVGANALGGQGSSFLSGLSNSMSLSDISKLAGVAAPLIGGAIGANATKQAANTQAGAANQASQLQNAQFQQTRADLSPFLNSGSANLNNLNYLTGNTNGTTSDSTIASSIGMGKGDLLRPFSLADFKESPAYQFNLDQGRMAIEKAARRSGKAYAPQTLQDIGKYSQGVASNEFGNAYNMYNQDRSNIFNRLYSGAGSGQNAAAQTGGFGANAANNIGQNTIGAGNAQAAGQVGSANAISGGLSGAYNNYLMQQFLQDAQRTSY